MKDILGRIRLEAQVVEASVNAFAGVDVHRPSRDEAWSHRLRYRCQDLSFSRWDLADFDA